jgi:tetratricopeptide (TPR) repeat protein
MPAADKLDRSLPTQDDAGRAAPPGHRRIHLALRGSWLLWLGVLLAATAWIVYSQGPAFMASWYFSLAERKIGEGDLEGALADMDRGVEWAPNQPSSYMRRGELREELHQLPAALEDINKLLELNPTYAQGYLFRSGIHQRLKQHRQAIDDCNQAIKHLPKNDPDGLNSRAYVRAIAHLELNEALADINKALELIKDRPDPTRQAMYLDTRGYLYHLLGRQQEGLADMETAIELFSKARAGLGSGDAQRKDPRMERVLRYYDESLAVMLHHRGLILQALGENDRAAADLKKAVELGFNPEKGVY